MTLNVQRTEETYGPLEELNTTHPTSMLHAHTLHNLLDIDIDDLYILERLIGLIRLRVFNRMNGLQPRNRPSKNRVLLIQPRRSRRRNEKLTPVRPGSGVGHAHRIRPIVLQIVTELVFKLFPPNAFASGTVSEGVPGLDHEFWNNAVEDYAFEESASSVTDEVLHGQRCLLWEQPEVDVPECRVDRGFVGERGWACALRRSGCRDRLFLPCRTLVEDVSVVTRFIPEVDPSDTSGS